MKRADCRPRGCDESQVSADGNNIVVFKSKVAMVGTVYNLVGARPWRLGCAVARWFFFFLRQVAVRRSDAMRRAEGGSTGQRRSELSG